MKLLSEQTTYIENYIKSFDIKYYEVYMEILDHMILSVQDIIENDKEISFEDAVVKAKVEGFGKKGFRGMMKERQLILNKNYRVNYNNQIKSFFKIPQIIFTLCSLVLIYIVLSLTKKAVFISGIMMVLLSVVVIIDWIKNYLKYGKKNNLRIIGVNVFGYYSNTVFMWLYFSNFIVSYGSNYSNELLFFKLMSSVFLTLCLISFIIYFKIRKKTLEELKTQIFV